MVEFEVIALETPGEAVKTAQAALREFGTMQTVLAKQFAVSGNKEGVGAGTRAMKYLVQLEIYLREQELNELAERPDRENHSGVDQVFPRGLEEPKEGEARR